MSDRGKSRVREAFLIGAIVGGAALTVGVAVAATSPTIVPSPNSSAAPAAVAGGNPPPRVQGYSLLRRSPLVIDMPSGLRFLAGTGLGVTGFADFSVASDRDETRERNVAPRRQGVPAHQRPAPAPAPAGDTTALAPAPPEPDFPGRGEEQRSDRADPQRPDAAVAQADGTPGKRDETEAEAERDREHAERDAERRGGGD